MGELPTRKGKRCTAGAPDVRQAKTRDSAFFELVHHRRTSRLSLKFGAPAVHHWSAS